MKQLALILFTILASFSFKSYGQDNVLYVSTAGSDGNSGSKDKPFLTLHKARDVVRSFNGKVMVYIRQGVYYLSEPLIFTAADSRTKGSETTYKAYPGEQVTLSGGLPLKLKWKDHKNGIKKASVKHAPLFDQLFVNGLRQRMARYPNFNPSIRMFGGYAADAFGPERVKRWRSPKGGFVHALHKHEWGGYQYLIKGKDQAGKLSLEGGFQNNRQMGMHDKIRFVENIFEELDTIGEWFFDNKKKTLYYYPENDVDLNHVLVEVPRLKSVIEFRGTAAHPVRNISFEGLQIRHTMRTFMETKEPLLRSDWTIYRGGSIVLEGAENCYIRDCFFNGVGGNAIFMSNYNRNNSVLGCHIANAGASGVCFVGDPKAVRSASYEYHSFVPIAEIDTVKGPKTNNYPSDCSVENTLIYGLGQFEKQVAGVEISMALDIKVSHNTIYDVPRAGINISEGTWGGHNIEYNDVFNTVLESGDHGAFNSWGRDRYWHPDYDVMADLVKAHPALILADAIKTTTIHDNRFHCDHGWDIDLDDGSSNYHIYNNVCLNGGLKLREGFYRTVENNVMINNSFHPHVWFNNSGDVFKHNIVTRPYAPIRLKDWGKEVDYNLFQNSKALIAAQKEGVDAHSLYASPGFINSKIGDYRVKEDSQALKIGFKNFPMNHFGVTSPTLQAISRKVKIPVLADEFKNEGLEKYEFLGTVVKSLTTLGERSATGMPKETGVLVLNVPKASMLYGKLLANDVILSLDGRTVNSIADLFKIMGDLHSNKKADVGVFRNQEVRKLDIPLK